MNRVKCKKCGSVVGSDPVIKEIELCSFCKSGKKKKKKNKGTSPFKHVSHGSAIDLPKGKDKIVFRSSWERNFARYLEFKKIEWTYEERVFTFNGAKRRPFQYLPDFYEVDNDVYWEVKGYLRGQDRMKMRRFRKYYPDEFKKLKILCSKSNKKGIQFYNSMDLEVYFIEDLKDETNGQISYWE